MMQGQISVDSLPRCTSYRRLRLGWLWGSIQIASCGHGIQKTIATFSVDHTPTIQRNLAKCAQGVTLRGFKRLPDIACISIPTTNQDVNDSNVTAEFNSQPEPRFKLQYRKWHWTGPPFLWSRHGKWSTVLTNSVGSVCRHVAGTAAGF